MHAALGANPGPPFQAKRARAPVAHFAERRAAACVGHTLDDAALVAGGQAAVGPQVEAQAGASKGAVQQADDLCAQVCVACVISHLKGR